MAMRTMELGERVGALDILRDDHDRIRDLFRQFDDMEDDQSRKMVGDQAIEELEAHSAVEENIFYPEVLRALEDSALITEARASHHMAKILAQELKWLPAGEHYNAKFKLLTKGVIDHIKMEESVMFPQFEGSGADLQDIGLRIA
ncbi:MAG: hemerythrin domain-containing protein [Elusimicrobia bacterium]|nr:hemerythrin domain-containing protein [Elusimicrobiota bacterium]